MPVAVGSEVGVIQAENQAGESVEVSFEEPTVLYFYPRDNTPGCTTEASQFNEELETYRDAGVRVVGVSTDDVSAHASFAEDHGIAFDLLADPDGEIAGRFDVGVENGRADRVTFVIVDNEIKEVYTSVRPDGHARTVLLDMIEDGIVDVEW